MLPKTPFVLLLGTIVSCLSDLEAQYAQDSATKGRRAHLFPPTTDSALMAIRRGQLLCYFDRVQEAQTQFLKASRLNNYQATLLYAVNSLGAGNWQTAADAFCVAHTQAPYDPFPVHFFRTALRIRNRSTNGTGSALRHLCTVSESGMLERHREMLRGYFSQAAALAGLPATMSDSVYREVLDLFEQPRAHCHEDHEDASSRDTWWEKLLVSIGLRAPAGGTSKEV